MSGIVGFFSEKERVDTLHVLKRMLTRIKHRGTDYNGVYVSSSVGLGVARNFSFHKQFEKLALSNEDETMWIVWSGKVYNREDLILRLQNKGHQFKTDSDEELVLHLYQEYGANSLDLINGQFAFSIWDAAKNELFLARDRVGICPLYYSTMNNGLVFASEMKAIFEYPKITRKISSKSLSQITTFWTTIAPDTIFEGIFELTPGHYLTFNSYGIKTNAYWTFPVYQPNEYSTCSFAESINQFEEMLSDAVAIRANCDEAYGVYLSGGIDSSVTTAFIKGNNPDLNLDTFSISFTNSKFDESFFQEKAVYYYNTNHSKIICSEEDIAANFRDVVWHAETTMLRTAPVPMYLLSSLAKRSNIKTVISGEGADEILGGYNIFKEAIIREFWAKDPGSKFRPLLLKKLYPYLSLMGNTNEMALKMFFGYKLTETSSPVYSHILRWCNTSRIRNYFSSDLQYETRDYNPIEELTEKLASKLRGIDLLSRAQYLESNIFMSGHLLSIQGERMAMANSVEGRYPFLDHRVIELCMKMRPEFKLKGLNEKYILKKMMKGRVPIEILNRSKQPYRAPISTSLLSENAHNSINEFITEKSIVLTGIFDSTKVNKLISRMKENNFVTEIDNMALTAILSTQILNTLFIEKTSPALSESDLIKLDDIVYDNIFKFA